MAITQTITQIGARILKIVEPGFTADAHVGITLDLHATGCKKLYEAYGYPKRVTLQGRHTTGATDTVDCTLRPSNTDADFGAELVQITDVTDGAEVAVGMILTIAARFWKSLINTVGAGNTLELTWVLEF